MRLDTGPVVVRNDPPGVYIRGPHALHFVKALQVLLRDNCIVDSEHEITMENLMKVLATCDESKRGRDPTRILPLNEDD